MFVGHYGPSFAVKAADRTIPLWLLFLAVQIVDVFWAIFVLLGIEKVRIVPGITASNPLDLYYMPYTHSLVAAFAWSLAGLVLYRFLPGKRRWLAAAGVALAVLSHWLLDLLVHRPDLPLYDNTAKVGLGLWNFPLPAFALEGALLFAGMVLYLRSTHSLGRVGRYGPLVFGAVMLAIQGVVFFGSPPPSPEAAAWTALGSYFLFAGVAAWIEADRG